VPKVTVELSSSVGLSVHPSVSATLACLANRRIWQSINIRPRAKCEISALSATVVFSQAQRMTGAKLKSTYSR